MNATCMARFSEIVVKELDVCLSNVPKVSLRCAFNVRYAPRALVLQKRTPKF